MADWILHAYGVSTITPVKQLWLAMTFVSILLKLGACVKLRQFPGIVLHLLMCCVFAAFQHTKSWGMFGEIAYSLCEGAFTADIMYIGSRNVEHQFERSYIRGFVLAIGALVICVSLYAQPVQFPRTVKILYFMHLYTVVECLGCVYASAAYHWYNKTDPARSVDPLTLGSIAWFGASLWAGTRIFGDFWASAIEGIAIQIACLCAWLYLDIDRIRRSRLPSRLAISRL